MDETGNGSVFGNLMTLVNALGQDTIGIWYAISVFCYIGGFVCVGLGLIYLARRPQSRQAYGITPTAWFWSMAIGICLFAFPEFLAQLAASFANETSEIAQFDYSAMLKGGGAPLGSCTLNGMRPILQVFGVIFCIRALLTIRRMTAYGGNTHTLGGQALIILAGLGLIHMQHIISAIYAMTGISLGQMC